jgi:nucleoside-diphosphate-sugar epimerase
MANMAVTGGTGLVGSRIVERLVERKINVRVLTRKASANLAKSVEVFTGDLNDRNSLRAFLAGVDGVFHCAAEIADDSLMEATNVHGTRNVVSAANDAGVKVFCHLSSVGVIGPSAGPVVDESAACVPRNRYEMTKLQGERVVVAESRARNIVLRPTNVVSEARPGVLDFLKLRTARDYLKLFLKGREVAHIVHVDDVAASALHLALNGGNGLYIVSTDDEGKGTYGEILSAIRGGHSWFPVCPLPVANRVRNLLHGASSAADLRYSARRLRDTGFRFEVGLNETMRRLSGTLTRRA